MNFETSFSQVALPIFNGKKYMIFRLSKWRLT